MKKARLTKNEKEFLQNNRHKFTTAELLLHINTQRKQVDVLKITTFRTLLYKADIRRCSVLRWTRTETQYLLDNYKVMGNIAIAKALSTKGRVFTRKNVDKKMILMGITRTPEELQGIIDGHQRRGVYHKGNVKRWDGKRVPEGGRKVQFYKNGNPYISIKVNGLLVRYARHRYQELHGQLPTNTKVYYKDMDPMNVVDDNLVAMHGTGLTAAQKELYRRNCQKALKEIFKNTAVAQTAMEPLEKTVNPTAKKIPVRIDYRTVVYVPLGSNIAQVKEQYRPLA